MLYDRIHRPNSGFQYFGKCKNILDVTLFPVMVFQVSRIFAENSL